MFVSEYLFSRNNSRSRGRRWGGGLEWVLKAWYDGVTKENVINSFKACGIGAIGTTDDHLIHCLKDGNGIPNDLYQLTKARDAAEAQELAEILAGFEIKAKDEDDTGHVSEK
ncbi:Protein W02H5.4 [Aphelenchoides avenae]|nr:Protein W02H5.4 [Aphelenchus avenae]